MLKLQEKTNRVHLGRNLPQYTHENYIEFIIERYRVISETIPCSPIPRRLAEISEDEWQRYYAKPFENYRETEEAAKTLRKFLEIPYQKGSPEYAVEKFFGKI